MKTKALLFLSFIYFNQSLAGLGGCDDLSVIAEMPVVDFNLEIQPIFDQHCIACHGPPDPIAFMDLTLGYDDLIDVESFQIAAFNRVKPGAFSQSYLFLKINCGNQISGDRMPREAPPLSLTDQALIRDWINQLLIFSDGFDG